MTVAVSELKSIGNGTIMQADASIRQQQLLHSKRLLSPATRATIRESAQVATRGRSLFVLDHRRDFWQHHIRPRHPPGAIARKGTHSRAGGDAANYDSIARPTGGRAYLAATTTSVARHPSRTFVRSSSGRLRSDDLLHVVARQVLRRTFREPQH